MKCPRRTGSIQGSFSLFRSKLYIIKFSLKPPKNEKIYMPLINKSDLATSFLMQIFRGFIHAIKKFKMLDIIIIYLQIFCLYIIQINIL